MNRQFWLITLPDKKRADLNPLSLPIIHSLAANALISWGAGRHPLEATIREKVHQYNRQAFELQHAWYLLPSSNAN